MKALVPLLGLLLLMSSSQAAQWHNRRLKQQASYNNLLSAAQSEVRVIQQLYNGVFREQGWANTADFKPLLKMGLNPQANMTAFFPSDDSWQRVADYYCLTQQGVLDNISNLREMLANYIKSHLVPNMTLHSSQFRDGMVLQTLAKPTTDPNGPFLTHKLSKVIINGSVVWKFKNASIYKIPGTVDYEDITVNPRRMDIRAGNGIIHVIDTLFRNSDTERFWEGLRSQVLDRAGLPASSRVCPANSTSTKQEAFAPSQIAGLVIGVVIGLLLLAGVLMLIFVVKSHHQGFLQMGPLKSLSLRRSRTGSPGGGSTPQGGDSDSPGAASGSGDVFTSPLLHLQGPPGSRLTPQASLAGSSSLQTNGSWAARVSGSSGTGSLHIMDAAAEQMLVVNEEGPLGEGRPGSNNPAASVARHSSSTATVDGDAISSSNTMGYHRVTDSFGSGTPFVSRNSGHGSKKDLLAAAAAGAAVVAAAGATDMAAEDAQLFDLLGGGLTATESVPVGRINHEHVIPFSELTLKELIGSGAEGKVYRGTWKHTDIAAKEYLPIEPAQEPAAAAHRDQSPSDAAMAHARAALEKEVHWLTSLNHPNLVRFCAVCLERPLVVMEFYKHGSVFAMLQKAARELARSWQARRRGYVAHFNWDRRLEMLHDVAAGMSYLHGKDHVHGDLRSPNLFVGADGKVKIGDFGFTKRLACNTASLKVKRITHPRWVAPELMMDNTMSRASDVYSFGIIMYELLTFRIPFDMLGKEQVVINVVQGSRPDVPGEDELPPGTSSSTCLLTYVRLMKECWAHDPAERPSFEVIARRLKAMQRWRKLISKHGTLFRTASALRQSSSCSSLYNNNPQGKSAPAAPATPGHNGSPQTDASGGTAAGAGAAAAAAAAGNGTGVCELQRARSALASPGLESVVPTVRLPYDDAPGSPSSQQDAAGVPSYSSDYDEDELPGFDDLEEFDPAMTQPPSGPVSEAVVQGTRLAVIGVCSHQDGNEALASVAGTELSLARKVVLVGSDLPAGAFSRQSLRGGMNSLEDGSRRRIGSAGPSFTAGAGVQAEQMNRALSAGLVDKRWHRRSPATTVAAAAAALASAAAAAAAGLTHRLPPSGRSPAAASATAEPTTAAAAAADLADGSQPRRHSDPMPAKGRMLVDVTPNRSPVAEASTAGMSSGQSPLAMVHIAHADLTNQAGLEQVQLQEPKQQLRDGMTLLESYPLSNTGSGLSTPAPASPFMEQQALNWLQQQQQGGTHALQLQQQQQQQRLKLLSAGQPEWIVSPEQQLAHQLNQPLQHQQQQASVELQRHNSTRVQDAHRGISRQASAASGAEAAAAADQEWGGEVYTPFDSPFYQDLTWAPSASISGMSSTQGSFSVLNSVAATAAGMTSESSSFGISPFQHMRGLRPGSMSAAAAPPPTGSSCVATRESSAVQADATVVDVVSATVLKQALTIEYQANLTPMAAAAAEAVSVHGGSRRSTGTAPGPYLSKVAAGVAATLSAPICIDPGLVAHQLGSISPSCLESPADPALQPDTAASADVRAGAMGGEGTGVCTGAGGGVGAVAVSVAVDGLSGKPAAVKCQQGSPSGCDQQPRLRAWSSHMDVPPGVEHSRAEGCQRPGWMRLLGLRRNHTHTGGM